MSFVTTDELPVRVSYIALGLVSHEFTACFTQCLTSFSSIDHLLCLYAGFLILFHLK